MSYYAEVWLRGPEVQQLQKLALNPESYHPHITLARPFTPLVDESIIQNTIVGLCINQTPFPFTLEGLGHFDDINYVPVTNAEELLRFSYRLEQQLEPYVEFAPKLSNEKTLHVTVGAVGGIDPFPRYDIYALRLTCMRNKEIWFSYDFVTQEVLDKDQSLDAQRWEKSTNIFLRQL